MHSMMLDDREEKNINQIGNMVEDAELDALLAQWAEAEVELPDGFHESLMQRLQAEPSVAQPKKGKLIALSERFANKKVWVSTVAAAALVLCCIPVVQQYQENVANLGGTAQVYELQKSRSVEADDTLYDSVNGTVDTVNGPAVTFSASASKEALPNDASTKVEYTVQYDSIDVAEQLTLLQDELVALETQLATIDKNEASQAQRTALEQEIARVRETINDLELQLEEK